ncbi:MAG: FHA domain-containing protein [Deltaproteobacteria bacterium]|nr:FHA domain-containing protein [Deltaproteobacteria bacterium]
MSFWKRMLSADYRAAVAAEASGNVAAAAERYGLAGDRAGAVRMHVARAERAADRAAAIAALRDAVHWAGGDPELDRMAARALGRALVSRGEAEGVATARDRQVMREAAVFLSRGGDHKGAGQALEQLGDHAAAAVEYAAAGLVERVEESLAKDDDRLRNERDLRDAFASYQTLYQVGRRDEARTELARCTTLSPESAEYRRLLDELDARLITGGRLELRRRHGKPVIACGVRAVTLGRDPLADLALRSGGVSRHHAELEVGDDVMLHDLGSRNGTTLGGLRLAGRVPLVGAGAFGLGDECQVEFAVVGAPPVVRLTIARGLDRGAELIAAKDGARIDLAQVGLTGELAFHNGRPWFARGAAKEVRLGGDRVGDVQVQLIRGDTLVVDGTEIDVT